MLIDASGNSIKVVLLTSLSGIHRSKLMTVRIEKSRNLRNVIHSQTETQNAMNPESAYALQKAFLEFEKGECAAVAVY